MRHIFTTTLRLNLDEDADRRAYEHLRRINREQYHSYSKAIVAAVNGYFDRQEQLDADPYLETREKEDDFLRQVMETIQAGLRAVPVGTILPAPASPQPSEKDMSAALDFADSF